MSILNRDAQTSHIDYQAVLKSPVGSFAKAATRIQWMGYVFALVLLLLLAFNNWYLTIDDKILAVEDGRIVGTINYKNQQVRSYAEIRSDLKNFLRYYHSFNSATLADDRAVAYNSLCEALAIQTLEEWQGKGKISVIQTLIASNLSSQMSFDFEHRKKSPIPAVEIQDLRGNTFRALVRGNLVVTRPNGAMSEERVAMQVTGELVQRSRKRSLGLSVCGIQPLEESL